MMQPNDSVSVVVARFHGSGLAGVLQVVDATAKAVVQQQLV